MNKLRTFSRYFINAVLAVVFFCQGAKSQSFDFGMNINDCGTWEAQPDYYTEWKSVDTLVKKPIKDTVRSWVYDTEKMQVSNMTTLEWAPCGNGRPTTWEQYRVCQITGIRQVRYRIRSYKYIPKPKGDYEKAVDSMSKNNR